MNNPPRDPKERIITFQMGLNIVIISVLMASAVLVLFLTFLHEGAAIARTVAFTSIVMLEMVRIIMIRSQYRLSFFSNMYLIGAIAVSILLQVAVVYVPFLNAVFKTEPLELYHWGYIGAANGALLVVGYGIVKVIEKIKKLK